MVAEALKKETYDAVCVVHNETSTGVTNPIKDIAEVVRQYDDTLIWSIRSAASSAWNCAWMNGASTWR